METRQQIIKFIGVGGINTLFGYTLYAFFLFIGVRYFLAVLFSTCLGVIFNFFTTRNIVFKKSDKKTFLKFVLIYLILCLLSIGFIKLLRLFQLDFYLSGMIAMASLSLLAFILNKYFVFNEKEKKLSS
jgi:putative flippase GtrA